MWHEETSNDEEDYEGYCEVCETFSDYDAMCEHPSEGVYITDGIVCYHNPESKTCRFYIDPSASPGLPEHLLISKGAYCYNMNVFRDDPKYTSLQSYDPDYFYSDIDVGEEEELDYDNAWFETDEEAMLYKAFKAENLYSLVEQCYSLFRILNIIGDKKVTLNLELNNLDNPEKLLSGELFIAGDMFRKGYNDNILEVEEGKAWARSITLGNSKKIEVTLGGLYVLFKKEYLQDVTCYYTENSARASVLDAIVRGDLEYLRTQNLDLANIKNLHIPDNIKDLPALSSKECKGWAFFKEVFKRIKLFTDIGINQDYDLSWNKYK